MIAFADEVLTSKPITFMLFTTTCLFLSLCLAKTTGSNTAICGKPAIDRHNRAVYEFGRVRDQED